MSSRTARFELGALVLVSDEPGIFLPNRKGDKGEGENTSGHMNPLLHALSHRHGNEVVKAVAVPRILLQYDRVEANVAFLRGGIVKGAISPLSDPPRKRPNDVRRCAQASPVSGSVI